MPAQTLILAPGAAASTALWIVVNCAFGQSAPLSSTVSVPSFELAAAWGPAVERSAAGTPKDERLVPSGKSPVCSTGNAIGPWPSGPLS